MKYDRSFITPLNFIYKSGVTENITLTTENQNIDYYIRPKECVSVTARRDDTSPIKTTFFHERPQKATQDHLSRKRLHKTVKCNKIKQ